MTQTQVLFTRACKSYDPITRVHSVYRRMYYTDGVSTALQWVVIFGALLDTIQQHPNIEIKVHQIVDDTHPQKSNDTHYKKAALSLINMIRFAPVEDLTDYVPPLRWRRNETPTIHTSICEIIS